MSLLPAVPSKDLINDMRNSVYLPRQRDFTSMRQERKAVEKAVTEGKVIEFVIFGFLFLILFCSFFSFFFLFFLFFLLVKRRNLPCISVLLDLLITWLLKFFAVMDTLLVSIFGP